MPMKQPMFAFDSLTDKSSIVFLINVRAIVGGTGKYVLKQNTPGKADVWN